MGRPKDRKEGERWSQSIDEMEKVFDQPNYSQKYNKPVISSLVTEREFLFGVSLNLGTASNNYAEYTGTILAQLIYSMFQQKEVSIMTDSQLVVNQVKGIAQTRNFRLVELIKVVHALAFKFNSMGLDYIERSSNTIADTLAKEASESLNMGGEPAFKFYFRLESLMKTVKLQRGY